MLVNIREILDDARRNNYAIGCINTPNMDLLRALIGGAEDVGAPLIIDHAQVHDAAIPVERMAPHMVEFAKQAKVPVAVHVDHGSDPRFIWRCLRAGFTSAMYDLSTLPYEQNLAKVTEFTRIAHELDITVEAELGMMTSTLHDSHEGSSTPTDIRDTFTDPDLAARFATESGVDALAVCFGTVHGIYQAEPDLDIQHLEKLRAAVPAETALVMHGSSGVSFEQITQAINAGITKINYYSYFAADGSRYAAEYIQQASGPVFYHDLTEATTGYLRQKAAELITLFANGYSF